MNTPLRNKLLCTKNGGHRQKWISAKMKVRHARKLKKSKSRGPFWSYQLNSKANSAHLNWHIFSVNELYWLCCLASSSKSAPRILIFFQLPRVRIIHLSLIPLRPKPPCLDIIFYLQVGCEPWSTNSLSNATIIAKEPVCILIHPYKSVGNG